ncbi:MAG: hypothetical protein ACRDD7_12630 [Peptostreptococcaceae bacterium]
MDVYKYYNKSQIDECMDLITKHLHYIDRKFSYCNINGITLTKEESILLKKAISYIEEATVGIKDGDTKCSIIKLRSSLKNLEKYHSTNKVISKSKIIKQIDCDELFKL